MTPKRMLLLATGSLAGLALALLVLLGTDAASAPPAGAEHLLPAPLPVGDFELTAHTGQPVRLSALGRDGVLAVFFGYTSCPDVCPLTMANLGRAIALLGADSLRVQGALVTVDPARDSLARLATYVGRYSSRIVGLTGPLETLERMAGAYMAYFGRARPDSANAHGVHGGARPESYLVDHTSRTLIVRDGEILMALPPDLGPERTAEALALALRGQRGD